METAVTELRAEIEDLKTKVSQVARNPMLAIKSEHLPLLLPQPDSPPLVDQRVYESALVDEVKGPGPSGHRNATQFQGKAVGSDAFLSPPPVSDLAAH